MLSLNDKSLDVTSDSVLLDYCNKCVDALQEALAELVQRTKRVSQPLTTRISGVVPTWAQQETQHSPLRNGGKSRNAVYPAPLQHMADWHSSDHSSNEEGQEPSEQLVAAAMFLLHDSTLAGAVGAEQQATPRPLRNWDDLVQQHFAAGVRAATSSKLLAMRNAVPSASSRMVFASQVSNTASGETLRLISGSCIVYKHVCMLHLIQRMQ